MIYTDKIKELAEQKGISVPEICKIAGMSEASFNYLHINKDEIPYSRLLIIAERLGAEPEELRD